jgi:hypothetical protein
MSRASLQDVRSFLEAKGRALAERARRLIRLTPQSVGLRRADIPYAPSPAHFNAANARLQQIERAIEARLHHLQRSVGGTTANHLQAIALVEREVDRARRAFGLFFEVFSQRGSAFAPALAAHDVIAVDCYAAIKHNHPAFFSGPLLKPLTYMEHGYSPATMRRGVSLARLMGEKNPFPIIRIPWDRDNPWQSVFLHEVAHNLQADLGIWQENKDAVGRRLVRDAADPMLVSIFSRWHKEIFADLAAILLGGTAAAWGMMEFLTHPAPKVMSYRPGGAHPTAYLRVFILAEMLSRLGFHQDARNMRRIWRKLYDPQAGHRMPRLLLGSSQRAIPSVVDEIAFQPRRGLAQNALADLIRFTADDERAIRQGAASLARGRPPTELPPRFLVSASRHALNAGAPLPAMSRQVIRSLNDRYRRATGHIHFELAA